MAVERHGRTRRQIIFLCHVNRLIRIESSQTKPKNNLKIKCKYKNESLFFNLHDVMKAVYHLRGNHTVTLYEMRGKIRYHLRVWPLG